MDRRRYLTGIATATAVGLAGCSEDVSVSDPDSSDEESTDDSTDDSSSDGAFSLGETAVFSGGEDEKLEFTPVSARVDDVLVYASDSYLYSDSPEVECNVYLSVDIEVENTGTESVNLPTAPTLVLDGTQYETTYTSGYDNDEYDAYQDLRPGAMSGGWVVYSVEYADAIATLAADFEDFEDKATAEWEIDVGSLTRTTYDYDGLATGDVAQFGTGSRQYEMAVTDVRETQSYEYGDGYTFTEEAADGNKFLLVTVLVENTGQSPVHIPDSFDFSLLSGSSQYETDYYSGDDGAYDGGTISPGIVREGILQFEVPQSTSSYELWADLTDDISANWEL